MGPNIGKVKALRTFADTLRDATSRWAEKYADRKNYDKQGFGFTARTDTGWNAFKAPAAAFEAYVGTYGSSSVSNAWRVNQDLVNAYFIKALNVNKQAIFDSMADFATEDAKSLFEDAKSEIEKLNTMLAECGPTEQVLA